MIRVNFCTADGAIRSVDAEAEDTVMFVAVKSGVDGIIGDCGGNLSCATCHAYIAPSFQGLLPAPSEIELAMLECALHVTADSRLTCQVRLDEALDGLVVTVPPAD